MQLKFQNNRNGYLLGPYHCEIANEVGNRAFIGRNSIGILRLVDFFMNLEEGTRTTLKVGSFSEAAGNTRIVVGGEHRNGRVFNNSLVYLPRLQSRLPAALLPKVFPASKGLLSIGSNVVLSTGVTILSGVTIGDGAVIGAGSVVTKDVPPFAIACGNPARVLRYRFDQRAIDKLIEIQWWNFSLDFMEENIEFMVSAPLEQFLERFSDPTRNKYETIGSAVVLRKQGAYEAISGNTRTGYEIVGLKIGNQEYPWEGLAPEVKKYLTQLDGDAELSLQSDIMKAQLDFVSTGRI